MTQYLELAQQSFGSAVANKYRAEREFVAARAVVRLLRNPGKDDDQLTIVREIAGLTECDHQVAADAGLRALVNARPDLAVALLKEGERIVRAEADEKAPE